MRGGTALPIGPLAGDGFATARTPEWGRRAALWGGTGCVVLAVHLAFFLHWQRAKAPPGTHPAPPVVMIDLAPLPVPPAPAAPPVPHPAPAPKPVVQPPQAAPVMAPSVPVVRTEASLPMPPPRPPPLPPRKVARRVTPLRPRPVQSERDATTQSTVAPSPTPSPTDATAPAPVRPAASGGAARQDWQNRLLAHIAQYKTYPPVARENDWEGQSLVRFSFRRDGTVVAVTLVQGSGHAVLDQAALATLQRASPLPPPPASLGGDLLTFTLPLRFSLLPSG